MKKLLSALMIIALCLTMSIPAAVAEVEARDSSHFASYGVYLFDLGGGQMRVIFSVNAVAKASHLGIECYWVQQQTSSGWVDVTPVQYIGHGTDVYSYTNAVTYNCYSGKTYRLVTWFTCTIDGNTHIQSHVSNAITLS